VKRIPSSLVAATLVVTAVPAFGDDQTACNNPRPDAVAACTRLIADYDEAIRLDPKDTFARRAADELRASAASPRP